SVSSYSPHYLHSFPTRRSSDLTDEILMILPSLSCSIIRLAKVCVAKTSPFKLTSIISSHSSISNSRNGVGLFLPGALRTISQPRSEEHTSELQSRFDLVCRLLL